MELHMVPLQAAVVVVLVLVYASRCSFCAQLINYVRYPNQSFAVHISTSQSFPVDQSRDPGFVFFPFEADMADARKDASQAGGVVYSFLCLVSSSNASYTLCICMSRLDSVELGSGGIPTPIVWCANRDTPANGSSTITLRLQSDGDLVLQGDGDSQPAWRSGTAGKGVTRMEYSQQPINLVLYGSDKTTVVWQSRDKPTDTLTFGQGLATITGMKLVSWVSSTDPSEGKYSLVAEPSSVTLYVNLSGDLQYWSHAIPDENSCRTPDTACFVFFGPNGLVVGANMNTSMDDDIIMSFPPTSSDQLNASFLRLGSDGNLLVYILQNQPNWKVLGKVFDTQSADSMCKLPLSCGQYGVCNGSGQNYQCSCPATQMQQSGQASSNAFLPLNSSNQIHPGCALANPLPTDCSNRNVEMLELDGLDYSYATKSLTQSTEAECKDDCLQRCSCLAAFWQEAYQACFQVDNEIGSLMQEGSGNVSSNRAYLKVGKATAQKPGAPTATPRAHHHSKVIVPIAVAVACILFVSCLVVVCVRYRKGPWVNETEEEDPILELTMAGLPTRFTYKDMQSITGGFSKMLGRGGFGAVYAGTLLNGTRVAVKQLEGWGSLQSQGDREFRAEVAIMGEAHHYNVLRLLGFCAQGPHRLLVYEYMENGSLDQWLFYNDESSTGINSTSGEDHHDQIKPAIMKPRLSWEVRHKIAIGAAKGLAYLHQDCREKIIHMDIKPQNILLDENFVAKVADFGLSRLLGRDVSHVITSMRGTPGYVAPEWLKQGPTVDEKCDVFSFGMLMMEVISGRKNLDPTVVLAEQIYYPAWAFRRLQQERYDELTDAKLKTREEHLQLKGMINTAFRCILDDPTARPSMQTVIQMLEGRGPHTMGAPKHLSSLLPRQLFFALKSPSTSGSGAAPEPSSSRYSSNDVNATTSKEVSS